MLYEIPECNMSSLEKKLTRISNKCKKLNLPFHFEKKGEKMVKRSSGSAANHDYKTWYEKYILIDVDGTARVNDWTLVGEVERTPAGNLVTVFENSDPDSETEIEIPKRYWDSEIVCEHCHTNRPRNKAYIVRNKDGEFKEVASSCLLEFTHGLSAEWAAMVEQFHKDLQTASNSEYTRCERYINIEEFLFYGLQIVNHFGYRKSDPDNPSWTSTGKQTLLVFQLRHGELEGNLAKYYKDKAEEISKIADVSDYDFGNENSNLKIEVKKMFDYILSQNTDSSYIHNLQILCKLGYADYAKANYIASMIPYARKGIKFAEDKQKREETRKQEQEEDSKSEFFSEVGKRITISNLVSANLVTSWDTQYGTTYLYKFKDADHHVFVWYASKKVPDNTEINSLTGTVKEHKLYRDVKQTVLTRCRIK